MDIYAKEGTKVTYNGRHGYDTEIKNIEEYHGVKRGDVFTVLYTVVSQFHTVVYLKEIYGSFNTVMFD